MDDERAVLDGDDFYDMLEEIWEKFLEHRKAVKEAEE